VRHDFDNESAGRREELLPTFPDPLDRKFLNSILWSRQSICQRGRLLV